MEGNRNVGGLWCSNVLALLSRHADGELSDEERAGVVAHVSGCSVCARFGQRFAQTIEALRGSRREDAPPDAVSARLKQRLRAAR